VKWPQRSASAVLSADVPLVAIRGDGLLGGPPCGILLGNRDLIARISRHPSFPAWRLDAFRSAALAATLEYHRDALLDMEKLPAWQLLTTPIENLRNRAERIAPQLSQSTDFAAVTAIETRSPISAALSPDGGLVSYGVALTPHTGTVAELDYRLRTLSLPVVGRVENDRLILDLRTVLPRQDRALVETILGTPVAEPSASSEAM
jgi:L-seryl-tRNA(Ser) seleniumtransferase